MTSCAAHQCHHLSDRGSQPATKAQDNLEIPCCGFDKLTIAETGDIPCDLLPKGMLNMAMWGGNQCRPQHSDVLRKGRRSGHLDLVRLLVLLSRSGPACTAAHFFKYIEKYTDFRRKVFSVWVQGIDGDGVDTMVRQ